MLCAGMAGFLATCRLLNSGQDLSKRCHAKPSCSLHCGQDLSQLPAQLLVVTSVIQSTGLALSYRRVVRPEPAFPARN
jgi:hypothetical protein